MLRVLRAKGEPVQGLDQDHVTGNLIVQGNSLSFKCMEIILCSFKAFDIHPYVMY